MKWPSSNRPEYIAMLLTGFFWRGPRLISPVKMITRRIPLSDVWQVNEMKQLDLEVQVSALLGRYTGRCCSRLPHNQKKKQEVICVKLFVYSVQKYILSSDHTVTGVSSKAVFSQNQVK